MSETHGFELVREQNIPELKTRAFLYRHIKTNARLMSLVNDDENKVFGISFRTPPPDSTGLPHILEHSVLCGSRKYPVKEPFVELLKSSLQTFLNAMTYPDKTCYPVASQNLQDFYNLIDVYFDAVFYPRITPYTLQQEGWHYELENINDPLQYKGVVFNEMKGVFSSPDSLISEYSMQSLFPDTSYGLVSGGDPKKIIDLTFDDFKAFHEKYYHPSNSYIFYHGDDDPERRLYITNEYLKDFDRLDIDSSIDLQEEFDRPRRTIRTFAAGDDKKSLKGMITINWLLPENRDPVQTYSIHLLTHILLGMPGSPLRKALIESGLGEDLTGGGLESEIRQMYFSTGLKGIDPDDSDRIVNLVKTTLSNLVKKGIAKNDVEAAINSFEFSLRENNTGSFPRGLALMLNSLSMWLYGHEPLKLIAFEKPLEEVKSNIAENKRYFEEMIDNLFLQNNHRTVLILKPDQELASKEKQAEEAKLANVKQGMTEKTLQEIIANTAGLKELQQKPDDAEALAMIPALGLKDIEKQNKTIPLEVFHDSGNRIIYHDLFTNGIAYLDIGFNLHMLPQELLPYVRLFGRSLIEMGTEKEDYIAITQRISRKTGGIWPSFMSSQIKGTDKSASWLFLRGKTMAEKTQDMLSILEDILLNVRLDNRERFKQIVLEAKAREEQKLIPGGHQIVNLRLRAHFNEADWANEKMNGVSYLFFLRELIGRIDGDWQSVLKDLQEIYSRLIGKNGMITNITQVEKGWKSLSSQLDDFISRIPETEAGEKHWSPDRFPECEGMTIPSQINYVGKGINLYQMGYNYHGSANVICRFLRNSWLWDRVRVQGGAYGAFCMFDHITGSLTFVSYRDPNLAKTIEVFDRSSKFLKEVELDDDELVKNIIGAIGDIDKYQLPDAKGYSSMVRYLTGNTDVERQKVRDEVLSTRIEDFRAFADVLETLSEKGSVKVLGSEAALQESMKERPGWLEVTKVL